MLSRCYSLYWTIYFQLQFLSICTFLCEKLNGFEFFIIDELSSVISLLGWIILETSYAYKGGNFICFLLVTLDNWFDEDSSDGEGSTFYDRILLKFCCLWILNPCPYVLSIYFFVAKFTVFLHISSFDIGLGNFVFKNFKTLGHLIASIKLT